MSEPLERWAPRVASALERVPGAAASALRGRAAARARAVRGPRHLRIESELRGTLDRGEVVLSAEGHGAEVQELGGSIHGRPWLAVPVRPSVTASSPRRDGDLFAIRSRGRVFLASRRGGALDIRWRLVSDVRIKAQHYLRREADRLVDEVPATVGDAIRGELGVR